MTRKTDMSSPGNDDLTPPQEEGTVAAQDEQERLGRRLREAREYLGLSQEFVADELDVPRASVSAMETGKRKVGSLELKQLARLYKRPVGFFLEEEPQEEPEELATLLRASRTLDEDDRKQLVRFAQFLKQSGRPPEAS